MLPFFDSNYDGLWNSDIHGVNYPKPNKEMFIL